MKSLYNHLLEASILGDIDSTLSDSDELVQKKEIVDWLKDNFDFVVYGETNKDNKDLWKDPKSLKLNNKGEISVRDFRPYYYSYAKKPNKFLDLPVPEYIKFDNVETYSIVGDSNDLLKIDMNNLPHVNSCNSVLLRNWNTRNAITADILKMNIDNIAKMTIDIGGIQAIKWPKTKIQCTYLFSPAVVNYNEDYLKNAGYNFNINNIKGLKTNELLIPDYLITENNALLNVRSKNELLITKEHYPHEWQNLNTIFETKTFDKLYVYKTTMSNGGDISKQIVKKNENFIIKGRSSHVLNKYFYHI